MQRFKVLFIALITLICCSCEDKSGDYIEQLFTNTELTNAIRSCLTISKDTAIEHLCTDLRFVEDETYRMSISSIPELQRMKDTLSLYGEADIVDSLLVKIDLACVNMGAYLGSQSGTLISSLTASHPDELIKGANNAITDYFRSSCNGSLTNSLNSALSLQLNNTGATQFWNNILSRYHEITHTPISVDFQSCVMSYLLSAFYSEMEKEEALVRADESHRTSTILQNVFGN